ncbi:kinase-like domain-containing protein [Mycena maculata]|uniref:Kinase-like domain-containing protein n=1 Tax=Mycena maculata TaxID=230809 RepID=A0AAD7K8M3_9AGAR|nr:kinase-like domain-containing protein [Mycena maculata]
MNFRAAGSSTSSREPLDMDAPELEDYDIMEEIGSGTVSVVYLVNCKRGRLRNRQLALRKVSICRDFETAKSFSSSLHQALYHPSIVSLFSTFCTPSAHFSLLELCSGGTLSQYLDDRSMTEGHLRGVMKSLSEALIYLKKQGVVHRNIKLSNILLTTDGRIKLGNFDLATRLPPSKLSADRFIDAPHFVAPEILANLPYTCDADLWSVGCVSIACLSGRRPFEANSNSETMEKILNADYVLPESASLEIQDLVVRLLETDPKRRVQPHAVLSHPFLDVDLPTILLGSGGSKSSESVLSKHALFESIEGIPQTAPSRHKRHSYAPNKTAIDSDDARGTNRRNALRGEASARRIVSDPLPLKQRDATQVAPSSPSELSQPIHRQNESRRPPDLPTEPHISIDQAGSLPPIPVGTTRPLPFTTALLSPDVHKTVHGQISVLPSSSLLVDLRGGERRRGQKGVEVLLINPQGTQIEIYSAPHLSLPCCLAEPIKKYSIDNLPSAYWRQYNDAGLFIERIKQRTPKLILRSAAAKCTLMANASPADIELSFEPAAADAPRMRIRLSRQSGSLEIAKHTSGARGEEWTKKILKTIDEYPHISAADWDALEASEQDSLKHLARFWRTCEVLEQLEREDDPAPVLYGSSCISKQRSSRTPPVADSPNTPTLARAPPASFSSTQTLSMVNIAPRPPKLPFTPAVTQRTNRIPPPSDKASIEGQHLSVTGKTAILPTWCRDDFELTTVDQRIPYTKFRPSVGWCIRYSSQVSQGGRYKIMFFDGAVLEIDVDEDWAELTSPSGETTRHNIRDCNSKRQIAERMKVFGDFVSMFEDG